MLTTPHLVVRSRIDEDWPCYVKLLCICSVHSYGSFGARKRRVDARQSVCAPWTCRTRWRRSHLHTTGAPELYDAGRRHTLSRRYFCLLCFCFMLQMALCEVEPRVCSTGEIHDLTCVSVAGRIGVSREEANFSSSVVWASMKDITDSVVLPSH
jgi:hypothetical protein